MGDGRGVVVRGDSVVQTWAWSWLRDCLYHAGRASKSAISVADVYTNALARWHSIEKGCAVVRMASALCARRRQRSPGALFQDHGQGGHGLDSTALLRVTST